MGLEILIKKLNTIPNKITWLQTIESKASNSIMNKEFFSFVNPSASSWSADGGLVPVAVNLQKDGDVNPHL